MSLSEWSNKRLKKYDWMDIKLIKLSTFVFALLVAKLWTPILSLDWYYYVIIVALALIRPLSKLVKK